MAPLNVTYVTSWVICANSVNCRRESLAETLRIRRGPGKLEITDNFSKPRPSFYLIGCVRERIVGMPRIKICTIVDSALGPFSAGVSVSDWYLEEGTRIRPE